MQQLELEFTDNDRWVSALTSDILEDNLGMISAEAFAYKTNREKVRQWVAEHVAVYVLARFTAKEMFAREFAQQAIKMIQQIGTLDDVVREVENYRTRFSNDEFISCLETSRD